MGVHIDMSEITARLDSEMPHGQQVDRAMRWLALYDDAVVEAERDLRLRHVMSGISAHGPSEVIS
ncbi:hypothetical protein [Afifella pfennigii]|uniref:hypothetical protein n=1 Tax=Afifella pfennigii TaxID=209897 RepID=UPI00047EE083|nr:hypothetical protein [Afifella pfennigii]